MISLHKWEGCNFFCNLDEKTFFSFRETGYAGYVLKALDKVKPELYNEFDIYLCFRLRHDKSHWHIPHFSKPLLLFVVGNECPSIPAEIFKMAFMTFKQYLAPEYVSESERLFRIPVGPSSVFKDLSVTNFDKRELNVFFAGNLHNGRKKVYEELLGIKFLPFFLLHRLRGLVGTQFNATFPKSVINFSNTFHSGFTPEEYGKVLAGAKVVLCPYGVTETETMRHFEAMKQGCVIVTDVLPETYYFKNAPFIVIPGWRNLKTRIGNLLHNQFYLNQLHQQTLAWWEEKCSVEATVQLIIKKIEGKN
jgi:hypothetical protein